MNRIRIGVDGFNLAMPTGTGIASYGRVLAATLRAMGHGVEGVFGLAVYGDEAMREVTFFDKLARADRPNPNRSVWRKLREQHDARWIKRVAATDVALTGRVDVRPFADRLPAFDRVTTSPDLFQLAHRHFRITGRFLELTMARPPEVMHWTYPLPITLAHARNVYTIHDLVPLKLPHATLDDKGYFQRLIRQCCIHAAQICTVSEASRADIVEWFGVAPERVTNTYQAAPSAELPGLDPADDARTIEGMFSLARRGYFLFVGAIEPKKNVGRLIEAYLSAGIATPLVIAGARAWRSEDELRLIDGGATRAGDRIIELGFLPRALLLRLMRGARALAFPSLYEGFGLPVLEAMRLGTPVLTSNTGSLGEVAGDAALTVDPYSVPAITEGLRRLDTDTALHASLAERGIAQAAKFSDDRYRDRLATLYRAALAG